MGEEQLPENDALSETTAQSRPFSVSGDGGGESATQFVRTAKGAKTEIPQVFGGYRIVREIGRGGMGIVFEAVDQSLNRRVAIKVLTTASQLDELQRKRFRHESLAVAQLSHENIVPIYGAGEDGGVSFFAMRYISGRNLAEVIQTIRTQLSRASEQAAASTPRPGRYDTAPDVAPASPPRSGESGSTAQSGISLSSDDFRGDPTRGRGLSTHRVAQVVARIGVDTGHALQHAHDMGVIHRDVKPSNLILDDEGRVWVTDFGLAHLQHEPSITRTGELLGTLRYMSPEQAAGRPAFIDHRTDVYSLGVTLYELLTLKRFISGTTTQQILKEVTYGQRPPIRRIDPKVPDDLAVILEKAISRNPDDRYDTAGELAEDLSRFLRGEPIRARRPGLWKRLRYWVASHQKTVAAAVVGLICTCVVSLIASSLVWAAWQGEQREREATAAALSESEGLRLLANATLERDRNPGLGLALAALGAEGAPGEEANNTLLSLLDVNHEYATVRLDQDLTGDLAVSRDGQFAVLTADTRPADQPQPARIVRLSDGSTLHTLDTGSRVTSAALSPDGRFVMTASLMRPENANADVPRSPVLWESATGRERLTLTDAVLFRASDGTFDAASRRVVLPQQNDAVVFDIETGRADNTLRGHTDRVTYAEFSPDSQLILTVSDDGSIRVRDADTGTNVRPPVSWAGSDSRDVRCGFTSDSQRIFVGDASEARLYAARAADGDDAERLAMRTQNRLVVSRTAGVAVLYNDFLPQIVVASSVDFGTISEFTLPQALRQLRVAIAADGRHVVIADETECHVYDAETGRAVSTLRGHTSAIRSVSMADRDIVATVSGSRTLRLWHLRNGADRRTMRVDEPDSITVMPQLDAVVSQDGTLVATSSRRRAVTVLRDAAGDFVPGEFRGLPSPPIDAARLVTCAGFTVRVYDTTTSREVYRGAFGQDVTNALFTNAAQQQLLVTTYDGTAFLVSPVTNSRRKLLEAGETVTALSVQPADNVFLAATSSARLAAFAGTTGETLWERRHSNPLVSVATAAMSDDVVAVDRNGAIVFWNRAEESLLPRLTLSDTRATSAMFVDGDSKVVIWSRRGGEAVICVDAADGTVLRSHPVAGRVRVAAAGGSPLVAIASDRDGLVVWNIDTGDIRRLTDDATLSAEFAGDALAAVSVVPADAGTSLRRLRIWQPGADQPIHDENFRSSSLRVYADQQQQRFAVSDMSYGADVFDFRTGRHLFESARHPAPLQFMGFASDPERLISVSQDGTIALTGARRADTKILQAPGSETTAVAASRAGDLLITGSQDGELMLWSTRDAAAVRPLPGGETACQSIRFDASGNTVVTTAEASPVRLIDLRTDAVTEFRIDEAVIAEISPDGTALLVLSGMPGRIDLTATLIDVTSGQQHAVTQNGGTRWAGFHPAGNRYALLSSGGTIEVFRVDDRALVSSFKPATHRAFRFSFSPDGSLLAVDQNARLSCWNPANGLELFHQQQPDGPAIRRGHGLNWQAFSADGDWLLVTDFGVRRVPVAPVEYVRNHPPRELTDDERSRFRLDLGDVQVSRD